MKKKSAKKNAKKETATERWPDYRMEEFLLRVAWSRSPDHLVRRGEVMADVGQPPPDPPLTSEEMQLVAFAAKMQVLKCLRRRKVVSTTRKERA